MVSPSFMAEELAQVGCQSDWHGRAQILTCPINLCFPQHKVFISAVQWAVWIIISQNVYKTSPEVCTGPLSSALCPQKYKYNK